jgi:hypothetical protein
VQRWSVDGVDMTARGRRARSWTWLSGAVSAADTAVQRPAAAWPQREPRPSGRTATADTSWKARPITSSWPDASPMAEVRSVCNRPLLTVRDRQMPVRRARGGHGRRGPTTLQRGGDGCKLNRRVRPVHDDHLPRWQGPSPARGSGQVGFEAASVMPQRPRSLELKVVRPSGDVIGGVCWQGDGVRPTAYRGNARGRRGRRVLEGVHLRAVVGH